MEPLPRSTYLQRIIERKHNGLVKVITGIRRCGKSYLLFNLFRQHLRDSGVPENHIIAIALDDRANKALRDPDACYRYVRNLITDDGQYYVLLDEVQLMDEFEDVLNGFLHMSNVDTYVTGSNSHFLSTDIITEFRGRGDEIRVHPLSFTEYYAAVGGDWTDAWNDYMTFGGLPQILMQPNEAAKTNYLDRLITEIYLRDIIDHNRIRNEAGFNELVDILASGIGSLTNPTRLEHTFTSAAKLKLSQPTIVKFISYLEDAFLIEKAQRYDIKGRRHIGALSKYYFEDVGLRNARLNFRQQEETHIMENVIYNELRLRGYSVDVGIVDLPRTSKEHSPRRVEIDFVANLGSNRYYLQSAFALPDADKREQELRPLLNIGDSFRKIIVTGGNTKVSHDENGITTMGLKQFLLDDNSLNL
ncbi:ATPase AAA [Bifidobacterium margollesii]|uniref:ATPase AAA n=2 Tax=Bifidobacterium margollesii TaxID=2020964 RepID=A0A2N5JCC6_9BIFI|nr:ATPase AAA [Bifidobacterium margollesii]